MQFFVLILLFSAIFSNCFGEKDNDPPLPPQIAGADERCLVLTCTKSASLKDEKLHKMLIQTYCPSASSTEMAAANGWCVTQLITAEMISSAYGQLIVHQQQWHHGNTIASGDQCCCGKNETIFSVSIQWILDALVCAKLCGAEHINNVANNVPSIVHHVIR
ncbi:hypothetical protein niasHT_008649 [Heterodera trifolii]|uniref:Uncharacterized protein n=1 Tax=Heterodera trifolii TaxID=157864 RepID=A0ABD2MCD1_9BILA